MITAFAEKSLFLSRNQCHSSKHRRQGLVFSSGCSCSTWPVGPPDSSIFMVGLGFGAGLHQKGGTAMSSGSDGRVQLSEAICGIVTARLNSA